MGAFELTESWRAAGATTGQVLVVLVVAVIANLAARRAIARLAERMTAATVRTAERAPGRLMSAERAKRAASRAGTVTSVLRSLATVTIATLALLVVLGTLEINLGPLIAGAGVASVAIGFGAQSLVRDVLAGIFVILEDQYGVGDIIDAGEANGTVERITLRSTQLRDIDGTVWHVPNGAITRVGNKSQNWSRAVLDLTVSHDTDVSRARAVIRRVAEEMAADPEWARLRLSGQPDEQGVQALSLQGVTLRLVADTEPASQWAVERELRQRIKEAFDAEGIHLATGIIEAAPPGV